MTLGHLDCQNGLSSVILINFALACLICDVGKEVKHLRISKKCITFTPLCTWCGHYILKVFSLSYKKMWKFSNVRGRRIALISWLAVWLCTYWCTYLILSKCGVSHRLFLHRSFHNLHLDKRKSTPHFLFCVNSHSRSCVAQ